MRLPVRFLLRHLPALVRQHHPPRADAGEQQEAGEGVDEGLAKVRDQGVLCRFEHHHFMDVEQAEQPGEYRDDAGHQQQIVAEPGFEVGDDRRRHEAAQESVPLCREVGAGLAQVFAARVERAAQRADRPAVRRAVRRVVTLVLAFADAAALIAIGRDFGTTREVVTAFRNPGDQRRGDEGGNERDERGVGAGAIAEQTEESRDREQRGESHGADTDRVDVVEMAAFELDVRRREAERLVDDEVGDDGRHPRNGDVRKEPEDLSERVEDVELHQQQRDQRVENDPDDAPRMAVRQSREEVRPGQRAGVGVGDVDLELRDDDEQHRDADRQRRIAEDMREADQVHLVRIDRLGSGDGVA